MGYKLTLQRNKDNHVLSHRAGANNAENLALAGTVIIEDLCLYVPQYTTKISIQKLLLGHLVSKVATELSYIERSSYMKNVTIEKKTGLLILAWKMLLIYLIR